MNKISNHKPILFLILKRIWHNWPNCWRKQQLNINTITLFWDDVSYYQLTNVFKMQKWMSCLWQQPKVDNYDETSRGEQSSEGMIFPEVIPSPSGPSLPAARHNPRSGTDRLTNKVNKYFPPLLKANQILILEVWSAEKNNNKQLVEGNWSNWFSLSWCLGPGSRRRSWGAWGGRGGVELEL